jgi:hypothetical protein
MTLLPAGLLSHPFQNCYWHSSNHPGKRMNQKYENDKFNYNKFH